MTNEQIFAIAGNAASLILAIVAIWLTIKFYQMSEESERRAEDASRSIGSSVDRLEKLFEHLYTDTFSMMRDTYSDMRRHVFPDPATVEAEVADSRIAEIREEVVSDLAAMVARGQRTEQQVAELRGRLETLVSKAIDETREVEAAARHRSLRAHILGLLSSAPGTGMAAAKLLRLLREAGIPMEGWLDVIDQMREDGLIEWEGGRLGASTQLRLKPAATTM